MNSVLLTPFTKEEVQKALFASNQGPCPDGFNVQFFQDAWDIIGDDLSQKILKVLNKGESMNNWNSTIITLIHKIRDARSMKDYRPVSLCNVSYKIVARAITNRFRRELDHIIDLSKSAFISGRLITDNILIGYECMH